MRIGSLFSGIGGLELGLEWAGLGPVVWQVERDPFCRSVLARHWPEARRFDDVCQVGARELEAVDVVCGGFPCQDLSYAGRGAGLAGERSGLWREYARIVRELRPRFVVVENVAALLGRGLGDVLGDLDGMGTPLGVAVRLWDLPTDAGAKGRSLNPAWVECLMGLPIGWTDGPPVPANRSTTGSRRARRTARRTEEPASEPSATPSSRSAPRSSDES